MFKKAAPSLFNSREEIWTDNNFCFICVLQNKCHENGVIFRGVIAPSVEFRGKYYCY